LGARLPKVRAALAAADPAAIAASVREGQHVSLTVEGEAIELAPSEIVVQTRPAEGLAVAAEKSITVAVDTVVTAELRAEGLAREIVRRVQEQRKNAGFEIADRITTYYAAGGILAEVMRSWGSYINAETLTVRQIEGLPPADTYTQEHNIDGETITVGVRRMR